MEKSDLFLILKNKIEIILDTCALQASLEKPTSPERVEDLKAITTIRELAFRKEIILWKPVNLLIEGSIAPKAIQSCIETYWRGTGIKIMPQEIGLKGTRIIGNPSKNYEHNRELFEERLKEVIGLVGSQYSDDCSHVINAEYFGIPYFVTVDYEFIKASRKLNLKIRILRPIELLGECI